MQEKSTYSGNAPIESLESSVPNMEKRSDGQHVDHWVLSQEERAKGFIRPVRRTYRHDKCGYSTSMGLAIAETYARNPNFYGQTFCSKCGGYFPVGANGEFVWEENPDQKVGT